MIKLSHQVIKYTVIVTLLVIILGLICLLGQKAIIKVENVQENFNNDKFLATPILIAPGEKFQEFRDPTLKLTRIYQPEPTPDPRVVQQKWLKSLKNSCIPKYGEEAYQKCRQLVHYRDRLRCRCSGFCHCVAVNGNLSRCRRDINYQKCLLVNNDVNSCQQV